MYEIENDNYGAYSIEDPWDFMRVENKKTGEITYMSYEKESDFIDFDEFYGDDFTKDAYKYFRNLAKENI